MTITVNGARKRVQQRVAGTPNAQGERLFVVIFNYVVGMRECEVMRLFLQRGRPCSELLGVSIGVAVRAKVKIEWPRLRPMQNDGIAAELAVSQYIITTASRPPPEHPVQVLVRAREEPPQVRHHRSPSPHPSISYKSAFARAKNRRRSSTRSSGGPA